MLFVEVPHAFCVIVASIAANLISTGLFPHGFRLAIQSQLLLTFSQ